MPRRPAKLTPTRPGRRSAGPDARGRRPWLGAVALGLLASAAIAAWALAPEDPGRLRARAEAAERAGDWGAVVEAWGPLNRSPRADARSHLGEARAWLALGRAARADRALIRAIAARPGDPEPWLLRLERLRIEGRVEEAQQVGWAAIDAVAGPRARRDVLRSLTLALLDDAPEGLARDTLRRWIDADPDDLDARVALDRRIAPLPRPGDPDLADRVATLEALLRRDPNHVGAREVLIRTLADAGDPARGRLLLDTWPADARDTRYFRLRGRWDLDYDHHPDLAVAALRRALADLPHDWPTRSRLARALRALGREADARREAVAVARLREALDPIPLGRRLTADLSRLDDPRARLDLADLCDRVGLSRLADAWRRDAAEEAPAGGLLDRR